jgi:hypothetical protein
MENTKKSRVGVGQKPRGKQEPRGVESIPQEKAGASNEVREQVAEEPVLEVQAEIQNGGSLLDENSPKLDKTEFFDEKTTVAVCEGGNLEEMLAKSKDAEESPVEPNIGLRRATPEEEATLKRAAEKSAFWKQRAAGNDWVGEQPDGSFNVIIRLEEGYIEPVRQWAEAEGISVEDWCSRQLSHYLETWGQPAKSR